MTELAVDVENVGGIREASFSFEEPVSIISGPNATNKTSLLRAIAFGLGRDELSIRSDADQARVTLSIGDETVTRTARRSGRGVSISGEGWITDPEDKALFEFFGCLLEFNPLRSAVRQNEDIEPVLKEPMDIDTLERKRSEKMDEKRALKRDVERIGDVEGEIQDPEQTIERKREEEAELEDRLQSLQEKQTEIADTDEGLEELREERADLVLTLEDYRDQIADLEEAIEYLESECADVAAKLDEQRETADQYDIQALKSERQSLMEGIDDISQRHDVLQSVLTANQEMLNSKFTGALGQETTLMGENVTCWVCGESADVSAIEETIDQLKELIEQDEQKKREYEPQIQEIDEQIAEAKDARRQLHDTEAKLDDIDEKIESRYESLETKREKVQTVRDEIDELDDQIDDIEAEQTSEVIDLTDDIENARLELQTRRQAIETAKSRIESLEEKKREREVKSKQIEEVTDEINDLTDRIENLEHHLREEFNEAMDDLVAELQFERIERIWLDGGFDLVIARETDGSVRQDSISSLSESEREVVGLVLALAGYAAYDLLEIAPVLVIDTLGALDANRTNRLIEYFSHKAEFLIAAVLPENAGTIDYPTLRPGKQTNVAEAPRP